MVALRIMKIRGIILLRPAVTTILI
jgi:hypothetical protein